MDSYSSCIIVGAEEGSGVSKFLLLVATHLIHLLEIFCFRLTGCLQMSSLCMDSKHRLRRWQCTPSEFISVSLRNKGISDIVVKSFDMLFYTQMKKYQTKSKGLVTKT